MDDTRITETTNPGNRLPTLFLGGPELQLYRRRQAAGDRLVASLPVELSHLRRDIAHILTTDLRRFLERFIASSRGQGGAA